MYIIYFANDSTVSYNKNQRKVQRETSSSSVLVADKKFMVHLERHKSAIKETSAKQESSSEDIHTDNMVFLTDLSKHMVNKSQV